MTCPLTFLANKLVVHRRVELRCVGVNIVSCVVVVDEGHVGCASAVLIHFLHLRQLFLIHRLLQLYPYRSETIRKCPCETHTRLMTIDD